MKGRKYIGTPLKYYFEDVGLRNARLGFRQVEETHLMENIIYNELRVRGYQVDVGVVVKRGRTEEGVQEKKLYACLEENKKSIRCTLVEGLIEQIKKEVPIMNEQEKQEGD